MNIKGKFYYKYLTLLISIMFVSLVIAIPQIFESPSNPANGTITSNNSILLSWNISSQGDENISDIKLNWDGTNYSFMQGLVYMANFNNFSALGENDTRVADISGNNNWGTVVGGENISVQTSGCHSGNCFNFSGGYNYVLTPVNLSTLNKNNFTLSAWINTKTDTTMQPIFGTPGGFILRLHNSLGRISFYSKAGSFAYWDNIYTKNNWIHLVFTFDTNNNNSYLWINRVYKGNSSITDDLSGNDIMSIGRWSNQYFNGTIDDVMIFNRSLSASEIQQLYNSQLTKYDLQNWSFQVNQTLGSPNSTITSINFPYYICSSNSSLNENCTSQKTITQIVPTKILTTNFTNSIGTIRNDFYGISDYQINLGNESNIYLRNLFLNSNSKVLGVFMGELFWKNNSDGSFSAKDTIWQDEIDRIKGQIKFAYNNNLKVFLVGGQFMPSSLQNKTSDCLIDYNSCGPINYIQYANLQLAIINYSTNNGEYLSSIIGFTPYNEPHSQLLKSLNNDETNQTKRMQIYYNIYNVSRSILKASFPNLPIGGPAGHFGYGTDNVTYIHWDWWFANFTNQMDFSDIHIYRDNFDLSNRFNLQLNGDFYGNCSLYGGNCSRIYVSEFNVYNSTVKSSSIFENFYGSQIGDFYINLLNHPENNISLIFFEFEHPNSNEEWFMINESNQLIRRPYNVTKNFATRHRAGDNVVTSTSEDSNIKIVSSNNTNFYAVTVINSGSSSVNESLQLIGYPYSSIKDLNGNTYSVVGGIANLGILDSYDIKYLTEDLQSPTITIQSPIAGSTYDSTTIYFNLTLDEKGDTCIYSLNNFQTNYSMTKQGWVNEFKASHIGVPYGINTVRFSCNDTSNNFNNTASVTFTILGPDIGQIIENGGTTVTNETGGIINESINLNIYTDYYYKGINVYSFPDFLRNRFDSIKIKLELESKGINLTNIQIESVIPNELRKYFGNEAYSTNDEIKYLWESSIIKLSEINQTDNFDFTIKLLALNNNQETIFIENSKNIIISEYPEEEIKAEKENQPFDFWAFVSDNLFGVLILILIIITIIAIRWDKKRR